MPTDFGDEPPGPERRRSCRSRRRIRRERRQLRVGDAEPADATVAFFQACDQYAALAGAAAWLSSAGTPLEREMVDGAELLDGS